MKKKRFTVFNFGNNVEVNKIDCLSDEVTDNLVGLKMLYLKTIW